MASKLHARKKFHSVDLEAEAADFHILTSPATKQSSPSSKPQPHSHYWRGTKRSRQPKGASGVSIAVSSIVGFLVMGLFLGYFLLHHQHRKVIVHLMRDPVGHGRGIMRRRQGFRHHFYTGNPRYVTVVMPSVVNTKGRSRRLDAIQDTWGGGARAIYVVHNVSEFPQAAHAVISDTSTPEDKYAYPQLLLVPPSIGSDDGVPRLLHSIKEVYEKVNPDFAFFVNDHTYVIPAHLCKYLDQRDPSEDMYEGHALRNAQEKVFNSGAAGYVLSRATMAKLVARFEAHDPHCGFSSETSSWLQGNPGLVTQQCMESLGIHAVDTRAAHKWHRFHAYPLTRVVSGNVDDWYRNKHQDMDKIAGFDASYNELSKGEDCCSWDTISFHYVEWKEAKAFFSVQERLLEHPHLHDHELQHLMEAEWPSNGKDVGFYSQKLPEKEDEDGWKELIDTMRKISSRRTQRDC